ncbi:MAG: hypothetical protein PHQ74_01430 [Crocinitomicaceae bacterium]|nr:hypothetical protein [Crocinitomicaceae bacterium]
MKYPAFILLLLTLTSCEQAKPVEIETPVEEEYESGVVYDALVKNVISGDFNGDGKADEIIETLISTVNNKSIDALPQLEYDSLVAIIYKRQPVLSLRSKDKDIPELIVTKNTSFGLFYAKNEGDLDNDGADEISVVIDWADWSQVNSCVVYSLKKNKWIVYAKFDVREWQVSQNSNFNGFILKNKKGIYEVSTFDSEINEVVKPLKEVLVTASNNL